MSQLPAMPLFWGDYWSKTRRLTPNQHHAYLFLLGAIWMNNCRPLPDDDVAIAGEIGISPSAWRKVRPAIARFFDLSAGTWRNHKLEEVWRNVMHRIEKNRQNGKRGGRPTKSHSDENIQQNQRDEKPDGYVSVNPIETIQNQIEEEGSVGSREPTAADAAPAPSIVVGLPAQPPDPRKELFALGTRVLGAKSGGLVARLLRVQEDDVAAVAYTLRQAEGKHDAREYVGAILRGEARAPYDVDADLLRMGVRPDVTSIGDSRWIPPFERPGDDGTGEPLWLSYARQ